MNPLCPSCSATLAAQWTRCGICGHTRPKPESGDTRLIRELLPIAKASLLRLPGYDRLIADVEAQLTKR